MKTWGPICDEAVEETRLGDSVSKRNKRNKIKLILRECLRNKASGIIEEIPEKGIVKYAKPAGVIASLVPTTNPCLTPAGQILYAIKCRDTFVFSPHPRAKNVTNKTINLIRDVLTREGAPADIIQGIEKPSIPQGSEIMKRADLIIATGGRAMVKAATARAFLPMVAVPATQRSSSMIPATLRNGRKKLQKTPGFPSAATSAAAAPATGT